MAPVSPSTNAGSTAPSHTPSQAISLTGAAATTARQLRSCLKDQNPQNPKQAEGKTQGQAKKVSFNLPEIDPPQTVRESVKNPFYKAHKRTKPNQQPTYAENPLAKNLSTEELAKIEEELLETESGSDPSQQKPVLGNSQEEPCASNEPLPTAPTQDIQGNSISPKALEIMQKLGLPNKHSSPDGNPPKHT